jgi:hypothetical protein
MELPQGAMVVLEVLPIGVVVDLVETAHKEVMELVYMVVAVAVQQVLVVAQTFMQVMVVLA